MKKKSFSVILAVSAFLFIAGYLFGCSDGNNSGSYNCSETHKIVHSCDDQAYNYNVGSCSWNDDECMEEVFNGCIVKEGLCNSNNLNQCLGRYYDECESGDDDD